MRHAERMRRFADSDLYVVITGEFCAGRGSVQILEACLQAGVRLVQLREKNLDSRAMYELACVFQVRCAAAEALLIINDRVDIALATGADGVHLGQEDLPVAVARAIAPELILGVSTHDLGEALSAQENGASYVNIGPIYPTQTKELSYPALGPATIGEIAPRLTIPFSCMGGIKPENIHEVLAQGARQIAVVTAVTAAPDPAAAAKALREKIRANRL